MAVLSDRIDGTLTSSGATQAVALDISKAFDRVLHAGLLHKLKYYGISSQLIDFFVSILINVLLQVVFGGKVFTRISS